MKLQWKRLLLILAALALVAAACGSDSDDTSSESDDSGADVEEDSGADVEEDSGADVEETDEGAAGDGDTPTANEPITLDEECAAWDGLEAPEGFTVNLVTDIGKIDDGTFNQFAFEGLESAAECFGIENTSFIETVSEADYGANIATSLDADPNVIVTVGFLITTDTEAAALENPDVNFIGIDQFLAEYPTNMVGVVFNEDESGYIAGTLAASLSETGIIGVVAGREDVPPVVKFVNGYTVGAEATNPDIRVLSIYNESFNDPAKGASDANQFIGEGADVIFGAGGPTGSGGVKEAAEQGVWAIGVDQDEWITTFSEGTAPGVEFLASSAIKRVDLVTFRQIAQAIEGSFEGGLLTGTTGNELITYASFHDAVVPAEIGTAVEAARAGLADGSIETGICGIDGLYLGEGSACD